MYFLKSTSSYFSIVYMYIWEHKINAMYVGVHVETECMLRENSSFCVALNNRIDGIAI